MLSICACKAPEAFTEPAVLPNNSSKILVLIRDVSSLMRWTSSAIFLASSAAFFSSSDMREKWPTARSMTSVNARIPTSGKAACNAGPRPGIIVRNRSAARMPPLPSSVRSVPLTACISVVAWLLAPAMDSIVFLTSICFAIRLSSDARSLFAADCKTLASFVWPAAIASVACRSASTTRLTDCRMSPDTALYVACKIASSARRL